MTVAEYSKTKSMSLMSNLLSEDSDLVFDCFLFAFDVFLCDAFHSKLFACFFLHSNKYFREGPSRITKQSRTFDLAVDSVHFTCEGALGGSKQRLYFNSCNQELNTRYPWILTFLTPRQVHTFLWFYRQTSFSRTEAFCNGKNTNSLMVDQLSWCHSSHI